MPYPTIQNISRAALTQLAIDHGIAAKVSSPHGQLVLVMQNDVPAKMSGGDRSQIITFYDEKLKYVCTIHQVLDKEGKAIHFHYKDILWEGVRYRDNSSEP